MVKLAFLLLSVALTMQDPQGQDDPEENVPASCNNYHETAPEHKCQCGRAMHDDCDKPAPNVRNDSHCKTNCKPERCKCVTKCTT